ncbi:MAG: serine/threonine-protein kinase [Anaeromyxobacteraceae bacterium]
MRVFGKYRLQELLASGGMADVWRAEFTGAAGVVKEVALKLVRGEHEASSEFVRMFVEEARLASRLGHANVVQVFEFGQVEQAGPGGGTRYYIAMELVRGHHLGKVVERAREQGARLGLARAVHVAAEVAKGLAHAHRLSEGGRPLGIVHRDVSPHNVLVSFEGEVKLADFGIARAESQAGLTAPGTLKGKVAYMAPEQARGAADVDARADLFALGVVLWELCAGRRLFARESEGATLAALLSGEPISPPSAWNEGVPPHLDAVVMAMLARDPAARIATADAVVAALSGVLLELARSHDDVDLRGFMARVFPEGPSPASAPEPTKVRTPRPEAAGTASPGEETTRTAPATRRARAWRAWIAGSVVLAAVGGGWALWRRIDAAAGSGAGAVTGAGAGTGTETEASGAAAPTAAPTAALPAAAEPAAAPVASAAEPAPPTAPAPAPEPAPAPAPARPRPHVLASSDRLGGLPVPPASSGEGLLFVESSPWAPVLLDGVRVADSTPVLLRLAAGSYQVRLERPGYRSSIATLRVTAGQRKSHTSRLVPR